MSKNKPNLKKLFPKRRPATHKGDYGKVFILAGSEGMAGAAVLCSRGALRAGAGLAYLGVPSKIRDLANLATPEVIVAGGGRAKDFLTVAQNSNAIAVGPGLGSKRDLARDLLVRLSNLKYSSPVVLDADGLNAFVGKMTMLEKIQLKLILAPHPGEMAKLLGKTTKEVQTSREEIAGVFAKLLKCTVVLKGYRTVVANDSGKIYINMTGNPGMSTAGVGDVLTGMIAGLAAQGFSPWDAAVAGVYLHGLAGDLAAKEKGEYGMIASDLVEKIPYAIP